MALFDCKKYISLCRIARGGVSQSNIAEYLGYSRNNWHNKLSRNNLRVSELEKVAEFLDAELVIQFVDKYDKKPLV